MPAPGEMCCSCQDGVTGGYVNGGALGVVCCMVLRKIECEEGIVCALLVIDEGPPGVRPLLGIKGGAAGLGRVDS